MKNSDTSDKYSKVINGSNNCSLFDLANLLRRVGEDQAKLSKKELKRRSAFGEKENGESICFFDNINNLIHPKPKNN